MDSNAVNQRRELVGGEAQCKKSFNRARYKNRLLLAVVDVDVVVTGGSTHPEGAGVILAKIK